MLVLFQKQTLISRSLTHTVGVNRDFTDIYFRFDCPWRSERRIEKGAERKEYAGWVRV